MTSKWLHLKIILSSIFHRPQLSTIASKAGFFYCTIFPVFGRNAKLYGHLSRMFPYALVHKFFYAVQIQGNTEQCGQILYLPARKFLIAK